MLCDIELTRSLVHMRKACCQTRGKHAATRAAGATPMREGEGATQRWRLQRASATSARPSTRHQPAQLTVIAVDQENYSCVSAAMPASSRGPLYLNPLDTSYLLYVELAAPCKLPYHIDKCNIPTLYQLSPIGPSLNYARDIEHVDRIGM